MGHSMGGNMMAEMERENAIDAFKQLIEEMESFSTMIPFLDRVTTFNDADVVISFYDKFFTVLEVLEVVEEDGKEVPRMDAVAIGQCVGGAGTTQIMLIDNRFIKDPELFNEGVEVFADISENTIEGLPCEEIMVPGVLSFDEILMKIVETYANVKPVVIH